MGRGWAVVAEEGWKEAAGVGVVAGPGVAGAGRRWRGGVGGAGI